MKAAFLKHIQGEFLEFQNSKLLVAVSGGIDSMVLLHLCHSSNLDIQVAHCNFHLRGEDSNGDQEFVESFCYKHGITCFVQEFDTEDYALTKKISIQIAARELRYQWFNDLINEKPLDYVLTAHHLDDAMETFLINFTRGTGIEGLLGIPEKNNKILRPLLPFTREEIERYASAENIAWREDRTNAETKYVRNKIRKDVLPILKSLNTSFSQSFQNTLHYLEETSEMAKDASTLYFKEVVTVVAKESHFSIVRLKEIPNFRAYLHTWLKPYGFKAWKDIDALIDGETGKMVFGIEFVLLKNRDFLILAPKSSINSDESVFTVDDLESVNLPINLEFKEVDFSTELGKQSKEIFVDSEKLVFPLTLRKWKSGDVFYPIGMHGKKKLSKYFKDEKYSQIEKENTWLLCSEDHIVWIVGSRMDERFKITNTTTKILKIKLNQ